MIKTKTKSSYDNLGAAGSFAAIVQSTIIKMGTTSEKLVKNQFLLNGFEDMNSLCPIKNDNTAKKVKKYHFGNEFIELFDPSKKYIGQKVVFTYEGRNIQTDLIIYKDKVFYIIELKSSSSFDTKKAKAESESLFENNLVLNKLIYKNYNNKFEDFKIKGFVCCIDAIDNLEIYKGFKKFICDNSKIWEDQNFSDIVRGLLAFIQRQDLFNEPDIDVILKAFVKSNIENHGFFNQAIVKKYVNFVLTGKDMFNLFNLDYNLLCLDRELKSKETLLKTLDEKIDIDEDKELHDFLLGIINQFKSYDLLHNS